MPAAARVLMPLPSTDYDPTESSIPWRVLTQRGVEVVIATPDGGPAEADERMVRGSGLAHWRGVLRARRDAREAYAALRASREMDSAIRWEDARAEAFDGLVLVGGHAKGVRPYLESAHLQSLVAAFFSGERPVGAICHGVVLAARSRREDGRSVLHGYQTTALTAAQELLAWNMTRLWLGDYYRTYPQTVEAEVTAALEQGADFHRGPLAVWRDTPTKLGRGFVVRDHHYVSSRWPGDAYAFSNAFGALLEGHRGR